MTAGAVWFLLAPFKLRFNLSQIRVVIMMVLPLGGHFRFDMSFNFPTGVILEDDHHDINR